jgi:hypothetical protein
MPARPTALLAATLTAAALAACGGSSSPADDAQTAARGYLDALADGDYTAACRAVVAPADDRRASEDLTMQLASNASQADILDAAGPCPDELRVFTRDLPLGDLRFAKLDVREAGDGSYWIRTGSTVPVAHQMRFAKFAAGWKIVAFQ